MGRVVVVIVVVLRFGITGAADGEVTERRFGVEIAIAVAVAVGSEYLPAGLDTESEHAEADEEVGEGDGQEDEEDEEDEEGVEGGWDGGGEGEGEVWRGGSVSVSVRVCGAEQ